MECDFFDHMIFFSYIALSENLIWQFCKCHISESIIARGLKLYQFIEDDD